MLKPLDANRLLGLVDDGYVEPGGYFVSNSKEFFARQNLSDAMDNLLVAFFHLYRPRYYIHDRIVNFRRGAEDWSIIFLNPPFTYLTINPDPERSAFIKVYEDDKHIQTYEMLGRPEQWQAFVKWLWEYGNNRLICRAAIVARWNASRTYSRPRSIPLDVDRIHSSRKDPTHKHSPKSVHSRPLYRKLLKAKASKGKKQVGPSPLGMASLPLSDIEGGAREGQSLREKDPDGRIAAVHSSDSTADVTPGMKTIGGDTTMAGAE